MYYNSSLLQRVGSCLVARHRTSEVGDTKGRVSSDDSHLIQLFESSYCYNDKLIIYPCPF